MYVFVRLRHHRSNHVFLESYHFLIIFEERAALRN